MKTPYYEFNLSMVRNAYSILNESISPDKLFYALKANGELEILRALNSIGANYEIASIGEMNKLVRLGVGAERLICSLPIKTKEMIVAMYRYGVRYFVFDNTNEYNKISQYAPDAKRVLRISLSDYIDDTIAFGMQKDDFEQSIQEGSISKEHISGITFYLSHNSSINRFCQALDLSEYYLVRLNKGMILNIGGNFRLPCEAETHYYEKLREKLDEIRNKYNSAIYAEPGRSVVKEAGKLVCKVVGCKDRCHFVYLDAGHPTGISYCPNRITNLSRNEPTQEIEYSFFDITCSHRKLFSLVLPFRICENDILSFHNFGSYSICKHSSFHGWSKPKCVFYDSNESINR